MRKTAILAVLASTALAGIADAQTAQPAPTAPAGAPAEGAVVDELVVTADPAQYQNQPGHAVGDIAPELELSPAEVQSYGVSSVSELLTELGPLTRSDGGRGGGAPVTLLSGRRISGPNEINNIPTEAILRVDILPEQVALLYGYSADQRVVNIVLRPSFHIATGEVEGGGPTEGGQETGQAEADLFHVKDDTRLNVDLKYSESSALTEAARGVVEPPAGLPYALGGNVAALVPGAEIDPALSALAGQTVTVAGVPPAAGVRPLTLSDFAATANLPNSEDVARDRTLSPATRDLRLNVVASRPLPDRFSGTINATLEATTSDALQGLPGLSLTVPAGDPFSPFGQAVQVDRYVDAMGPLRQSTDGWTGHLGGTLNRDAGPWRLSWTGAYDHGDSLTRGDIGLDPTALQALLNADSATFNPFAAPQPSLVTRLAPLSARSISDTANIQFLANGPLLRLPAGSLNVAFKIGDTGSLFDTRSEGLGLPQAARLSRKDASVQLHIDAPIASRRNHVLPWVGELSLGATAAVDQLSDFGALTSLSANANWAPIAGLNLVVTETRDGAAPSVRQLGDPVILTPGVRLFDFATGQTVDVTQITGGNAALTKDRRSLFRTVLNWRPFLKQELTFNANFFDVRTDAPIVTFPAATVAIEQAFPDRFIRGADGALETVDYRPVNYDWWRRRGLSFGVNYALPLRGPAPPRPANAGGAAGAGQGPQIGQFQFAVFDTVFFFTDQMLVRPGGPLLDRLNGAAAGGSAGAGGQPQHQVQVQAGYTVRGLGARMSFSWASGSFVQGAAPPVGDLSFSGLASANLRLFADFSEMRAQVQRRPWLRGLRLTLSVNNLADARVRVRDGAGATPLSYQPAYLDPTGRSLTLSVRKLFY